MLPLQIIARRTLLPSLSFDQIQKRIDNITTIHPTKLAGASHTNFGSACHDPSSILLCTNFCPNFFPQVLYRVLVVVTVMRGAGGLRVAMISCPVLCLSVCSVFRALSVREGRIRPSCTAVDGYVRIVWVYVRVRFEFFISYGVDWGGL
jgi:hypothetical protein